MKRLGVLALLMWASTRIAAAHPLDISVTTIQATPQGLAGSAYIHPYEVSLLVESRNRSLEDLEVSEIRRMVIEYFDERFKVYARPGIVRKRDMVAEGEELYQIVSRGLFLSFTLPLENDQYPVTFSTDLFVEFFNTQTNKIVVLDSMGQPLPGSREVFLTARRTNWSFDPRHPDFSSEYDDSTDTDGDGLTDRMENLYGLDPHEEDTDGDGYSDSIEFDFGWDPFSRDLSPGQSQEAVERSLWGAGEAGYLEENPAADSVEMNPPAVKPEQPTRAEPGLERTDGEEPATEEGGAAGESAAPGRDLVESTDAGRKATRGGRYLEKVLGKITRTVRSGFTFGSGLSLFLSVFVLGFLHASMPGHGKGVLISYLAQTGHRFRHAVRFVLAFTVTHLIDVVILGFGVRLLSSAVDSARMSQILKYVGGGGLLIVALFLTIQGVRDLRGKDPNKSGLHTSRQQERPPAKTRSGILLGFLTGLAPCPFGWAILMILLSLGRPELILPTVAVFGIGIFTFLLAIALAVMFCRAVIMDVFSRFSRISRLVSGVLLLIFAAFFFTPRMPSL